MFSLLHPLKGRKKGIYGGKVGKVGGRRLCRRTQLARSPQTVQGGRDFFADAREIRRPTKKVGIKADGKRGTLVPRNKQGVLDRLGEGGGVLL